jgi:small neutral amino acid transporter SnatA (MarC family)
MNLGIADVIAILVITIGPLKAAIVYTTLTANADKALRRAIAFRTVMVATIVIVIFVIFGEFILSIFHISLAALKLAGGLILLLFALGMVMGEEKKGAGPEGPVTIAVAHLSAGNAADGDPAGHRRRRHPGGGEAGTARRRPSHRDHRRDHGV